MIFIKANDIALWYCHTLFSSGSNFWSFWLILLPSSQSNSGYCVFRISLKKNKQSCGEAMRHNQMLKWRTWTHFRRTPCCWKQCVGCGRSHKQTFSRPIPSLLRTLVTIGFSTFPHTALKVSTNGPTIPNWPVLYYAHALVECNFSERFRFDCSAS